MSPSKTLAVAQRVVLQLRHDPRTLGLLFVVPPMLITILKYVFQGQPAQFNHMAPMLLGIFPMVMMFLVTSIVTLRERTNGTLERLMTMPMGKLDYILGYATAFLLIALVQALISTGVMLGLLQVSVQGGMPLVLVGTLAAAFLGTGLGLFSSAFARTEFQAMEFMPAFLFPQLLMCGLFVPRENMARLLQLLSDVFPLTYSVHAMQEITQRASLSNTLVRDLLIVLGSALLALVLGSLTIRRATK
ncbi:MAG TPA: ABC transporter permease [Candidatus Saccharimonadales bacterium]|nr:ABC transporter permease [Candidatus Saccharimonadales bacterium]